MAVTYNAAVKTSRITATRDYFANGTIEVLTSADLLLATWGLPTGGGSIAGSVWTLTPLDAATVVASASGTATKAQLKTSGGSAHLTGLTVTATGGGGDIVIDNPVIAATQSVTMNTATITHA